MVAAASVSSWLIAAEHRGDIPAPLASTPTESSTTAAPVSQAVRDDSFKHAAVRLDPADAPLVIDTPAGYPDPLTCRFTREEPSGTSAKFSCVLEDGRTVK